MNRKRSNRVLWRKRLLGPVIASVLLLAVAGGHYSRPVKAQTPDAFLHSLTEEERAWLRDHPVIRVAQAPDWPPVEFADERGAPSGMSEDYLTLIEQRLGVTFERVRTLSWQEAYARLKRWEIDMTTSVAVTPERAEFWAFTKPYMEIPNVIFADARVTYIADMQELAGKQVAVADGYAVSEWIPADFPDIQLVKVKNVKEGLEIVQRGEVFAYVGEMLVGSYYLAELKMTNLKIAGDTPYVNAQCMAVRKDWAILAGILDKALDSISETERNDIYRKWLPIRYEYGFDYTLLWWALAAFAVISLGFILWIRKLTREIEARKKAEDALRKSEDKHRRLTENISDVVWTADLDFNITYVSPSIQQLTGDTAEKYLERTMEEKHPSSSIDIFSRAFSEELEKENEPGVGKNRTRILEVEHYTVDGRTVWIAINLSFIRDAQGAITGVQGVTRDITARKWAEEKIRESEETYRNLFQNAQVGLFRTRISDGKILESNAQLARMFGYDDRETFIAEYVTSQNYVDPGTREQMLRELQENGAVQNFQARFYRRDGSIIWAEYSAKIYPEKDWIEGVAEDTTARQETQAALREALTQANQSHRALLGVLEDQKEIEAALARTERIYRQAITQAGGVPYQRDYNSDNYSFLGEGIEKLTGYTAAELTGPLFTSRLRQVESYGAHKDLPHAERVRLSRQGVIKEWREDNLFERKDGSLVWLADHSVPVYDESGDVAGALGILLDITEDKRREAESLATQAELQRLLAEAERARLALLSVVEDQKRAEAALAAERTLLRTLVDHLPDSVYVKDTAGRKTLANPVDVRNTGAASEVEVLGKTDFELYPPELAERYHADDLYVFETGQPVLDREERITRPDGAQGWQLTSKVPLHDSAGQVVGLVGIGHDITERKQAAQELQNYADRLQDLVAERTRALEEAQERLLRQTRLATLGQIAGSIAHELRTPLGAIKNAAYLINMLQGASGETLEEALDILNQEVANSDRIITSLLNFARPQRPRQQLLEVGPLVERAARHLQPPPEVQVEAHVDGALSPVIADATHLEQALGNLLLNALQAMPEGGRLTVCAEQRASLPDIEPPGFLPEHATDAGAGWIVVSVGDTGVGIPPENLEHLFEPLFTTKTTGIGLGLALVKLLVQANGGGIAVSSAPGEGTTFDIYLPVAGMSDANINNQSKDSTDETD